MQTEPQADARPAPTTVHAARKATGALTGTRWEPEAKRLQQRINRGGTTAPVLVVAGESGRGKSTLVSALLGRAEASPSGRGGITALPVEFAPPTPEREAGRAYLVFDEGVREIPADRLPDWVRTGGAELAASADPPPRSALHVVEGPSLPGVTIIDTPGAGGRNPLYARAAVAASGGAGVLVIVTDAAGRLTAPALEFIRACAGDVDHVIVAMNGIDANRAWAAVAAENRELLAQHLPGFGTEVVGVSALRALGALDEADEARSARLAEASGLPQLLDRIRSAFERGAARRARRSLGELDTLLAAAHREAQEELDSLSAEQGAGSSVKPQLQALGEAQGRAEKRFNRETQDLWDDLGDRAQRAQFALNNQWIDQLAQSPLLGLTEEQRLRTLNEFKAELELTVHGILADGVTGAVGMTRSLFHEAGLVCPPSLLESVDRLPRIATPMPQSQVAVSTAAKGKGVLRGGMVGLMAGRPFGALGTVVGGLAGVIGGAALVKRMDTPRLVRDEITRGLQDCFMTVRRELGTQLKRLRNDVLDEFREGCAAEAKRLRGLGEQENREAVQRGKAIAAAKEQMSELHTARQLVRDETQRLQRIDEA